MVPDEVGQAARVENDLINVGVLLLVGQLTILKQGSVALDGVYRRLELVGHIAYKIGLERFSVAELLDHGVEAAVNLAHVAYLARAVEAHGEVPARDLAHRVAELHHRAYDYLAQPDSDSGAGQDTDEQDTYRVRHTEPYAEPAVEQPYDKHRESCGQQGADQRSRGEYKTVIEL